MCAVTLGHAFHRVVEAVHDAPLVHRKVLDAGIEKYLKGHPVEAAYRKSNLAIGTRLNK